MPSDLTTDELRELRRTANDLLDAAMARMSEALQRDDIDKGLAHCVGLILERWQGSSDDEDAAQTRIKELERQLDDRTEEADSVHTQFIDATLELELTRTALAEKTKAWAEVNERVHAQCEALLEERNNARAKLAEAKGLVDDCLRDLQLEESWQTHSLTTLRQRREELDR